MRWRAWLFACALAACSSKSAAPPAQGSGSGSATAPRDAAVAADDRFDPSALGATTFALTEGTPEARAAFVRGLLALHSFWYDEARRQFEAAIAADPKMNMAYWGKGLSYLKLLWGDDDLDAAKDALSRMPDPDKLSVREQAWVLAAIALVQPGDVRESRKRFLAAMQALHAQFPDDESATFLALALLSTTRPEDPDTIEVRKRAAGLAAEVYQRNPNHPGAAHYLIHAYDTPELAPLALEHARAYAKLAPAAFHARHMPAHIFSRLGMWSEAIASCQAAWDASVAAAARHGLSADHHDFHSLTWLVEMNFELGHRKAADAALAIFAKTVEAGLGHDQRTLYATQVESYLARTGEWQRAAELLAPLAAPAALAPPSTRSEPTHCAPGTNGSPIADLEKLATALVRARAAAMQHDPKGTKRALAEVAAARATLAPYFAKTLPAAVVAQNEAAQARRTKALLARAANDDRALLAILRTGSASAAPEVGGESNPSAFVPAEELADTLLRIGKFQEALAGYARVLAAHPRRASALLGSARAAAGAGDKAAAVRWYRELLMLWATADDGIAGRAEARAATSS